MYLWKKIFYFLGGRSIKQNDPKIISMYMKEVNEIPLLSTDEERQLGQLIYNGNIALKQLKNNNNSTEIDRLETVVKEALIARNKLIEANYRLVLFQLKKYSHNSLPFMDLVQEGNKGLMQAANNFNYKLGNRFSTYAIYWIDQALKRAVDNLISTIKIPIYVRDLKRRINKFSLQYLQANGFMPTEDTIINSLQTSEKDYLKTLNLTYSTTIHQQITEKTTLEDYLPDQNSALQDKNEENVDLDKLLNKLTNNERYVIERRFGLNSNKVHTLKQLAIKLDLSVERIRQIQQNAIKKLRK